MYVVQAGLVLFLVFNVLVFHKIGSCKTLPCKALKEQKNCLNEAKLTLSLTTNST